MVQQMKYLITIKFYRFILTIFVALCAVTECNQNHRKIVCIRDHLKKVQLIQESSKVQRPRYNSKAFCDAYIKKEIQNFYDYWQFYFKNHDPKPQSNESIRCFVNLTKSWELHDRYLYDTILYGKKSEESRKLFRRNNYLYERLINEAIEQCNLG